MVLRGHSILWWFEGAAYFYRGLKRLLNPVIPCQKFMGHSPGLYLGGWQGACVAGCLRGFSQRGQHCSWDGFWGAVVGVHACRRLQDWMEFEVESNSPSGAGSCNLSGLSLRLRHALYRHQSGWSLEWPEVVPKRLGRMLLWQCVGAMMCRCSRHWLAWGLIRIIHAIDWDHRGDVGPKLRSRRALIVAMEGSEVTQALDWAHAGTWLRSF